MDFDKLKRKASDAAAQAKVKAGELQEKSKPRLEQAKVKASELGEKASDAIQKGADKATESAKSFREGHNEDPSAPPTATAEPLRAAPDPTVPAAPHNAPPTGDQPPSS